MEDASTGAHMESEVSAIRTRRSGNGPAGDTAVMQSARGMMEQIDQDIAMRWASDEEIGPASSK